MESIVSNLKDILDLVIWNEDGKYVINNAFKSSDYSDYENKIEKGNDYYEGTLKRVYSNKYERNPKSRAACIKHYGYDCQICQCNFEKKYGAAGKKKIHVHHIEKLSQIRENHIVDPIRDMITVCANCHFIIHSREEPYSIDEMKQMLREDNDL